MSQVAISKELIWTKRHGQRKQALGRGVLPVDVQAHGKNAVVSIMVLRLGDN